MKFQGLLFTAYDGENNGGEGTLTVDGKTHKLEFSATPHQADFTVDGQLLTEDNPLDRALTDFFAETWPDEGDDRWVVDDEANEYEEEEDGDDDGDHHSAYRAEVTLQN